MSGYYFVIHDTDGNFVNEQPYSFPDFDTAISAAKLELTDMAVDGVPLEHGQVMSIIVQDEDRAALARLELRYSFKLLMQP